MLNFYSNKILLCGAEGYYFSYKRLQRITQNKMRKKIMSPLIGQQ